MSKLETMINTLLEKHVGGEEFFNHLDETIKKAVPVMEDFLNTVKQIENKHVIMSGGFGEVFKTYLKSKGISPLTLIVTKGSLRKGTKIDLSSDEVYYKEFIFLDDSFYSGSTRKALEQELEKYGSTITDTYVVYDGSIEKDKTVHSMYRYYDHINKVRISNIEEMMKAVKKYNVPYEVVKDVDQRITDWRSMGGSIDAPYIQQQFRFVENFINSKQRRAR